MSKNLRTRIIRTLLVILLGLLCMQMANTTAQESPFTPFVAWSPDGQFLASSRGTSVTIYDASTMMELNTFGDLDLQFTSSAWSPDSARLAISDGHDLEVWRRPWSLIEAQQEYIYSHDERYDGPTAPISFIIWRPDGSEVAVAHGDVIDVVDTSTGGFIREITGDWGHITDVDWAMDRRLAISSVLVRFAYSVDSVTGSLLNRFYTGLFSTSTSSVDSVAFSPDGNKLAVGTSDGVVVVWSNTLSAPLDNNTPDLIFGYMNNDRHSLGVNALAWSSMGQYLASGSQDGTIYFWDAATGELLEIISLGEDAWVYSLAWSPDGSRLAYGNPDGSVAFFDATQLPGYVPMATVTPSPR